ncbi:carbohydrate ABC transporter permease [Streptacidiphilus carbonis]|jgi:multiple sugar transport system permease protein|uniref:carbohydrate ABC transporter permease n=1 Tax=Streptacidiphilus carbonis TaxID=105422 RepID=UPI0005A8FA0A|nr:carbohydrate ABC transporter permease [Streptacidiphilus carbonis]
MIGKTAPESVPTGTAPVPRRQGASPPPGASRRTARPVGVKRSSRLVLNGVLALTALYFLLPVWWLLVSSTKTNSGLFGSNGFWFAGLHLVENVKDVFSFGGGLYGRWILNSAIYSGLSGIGATVLGSACGYALAKFEFRGRGVVFGFIMSGVLVPSSLLTVPLYLMFSKIHLVDTYWAVIIPSVVSPFAVYLSRVYAQDAIPDTVLEAARIDGAGELRIFTKIVVPMMRPALVTVFLFSFVAAWNNFFLALVMLSNQKLYPITLGLYQWFTQKDQTTYNVVITGSLLSVLPLVIAFLALGRFWRAGLSAGSVKG